MPTLGALAAIACLQSALPTSSQVADAVKDPVVVDSIRPAGWSKDGRFAYFEEDRYNDSDGLIRILLVIRDVKSNREVMRKEFDARKLSTKIEPGKGFLEAFAQLWDAKGTELKKELRKARIVLCKGTALSAFPLKKGKDTFTAEISVAGPRDTRMEVDAESPASNVKLWLHSSLQGEKTVHEDPKANVAGAYVMGFFESPFDGRIAILWEGVENGFNGPPNVLKPSIAGTELKKGFTKK